MNISDILNITTGLSTSRSTSRSPDSATNITGSVTAILFLAKVIFDIEFSQEISVLLTDIGLLIVLPMIQYFIGKEVRVDEKGEQEDAIGLPE